MCACVRARTCTHTHIPMEHNPQSCPPSPRPNAVCHLMSHNHRLHQECRTAPPSHHPRERARSCPLVGQCSVSHAVSGKTPVLTLASLWVWSTLLPGPLQPGATSSKPQTGTIGLWLPWSQHQATGEEAAGAYQAGSTLSLVPVGAGGLLSLSWPVSLSLAWWQGKLLPGQIQVSRKPHGPGGLGDLLVLAGKLGLA